MDKSKKQDMEQAPSGLPTFSPEETRDFIKAAIEKGGVAELERVVALVERQQEKAAAREYHAAMRQFSAAMDPIPKRRKSGKTTRDGAKFGYKFAPLEDIARAIKGPLEAAGLSYTWDSEDNGESITTICTVRHIDGHAQSARFTCPTAMSTGMSEQHRRGSALSYGRRYSLVQALGLTNCDEDDDYADPTAAEPITEDQVGTLTDLIESAEADRAKVLKWAGVDSLGDIPQAKYGEAVRMLKEKGRRG